ncbi:XRE family transcriptional regulator [Anopheles sinensis]|uniref:XRE family transcriptional regulator n=1 Tax=Anopheles sinensis TaxID=74873 RepID=A0A084W6K5_ANOSI|nr:XRE family transcriptional regulator [Anopheles sinensis]
MCLFTYSHNLPPAGDEREKAIHFSQVEQNTHIHKPPKRTPRAVEVSALANDNGQPHARGNASIQEPMLVLMMMIPCHHGERICRSRSRNLSSPVDPIPSARLKYSSIFP